MIIVKIVVVYLLLGMLCVVSGWNIFEIPYQYREWKKTFNYSLTVYVIGLVICWPRMAWQFLVWGIEELYLFMIDRVCPEKYDAEMKRLNQKHGWDE